jgi:hypothetical protein
MQPCPLCQENERMLFHSYEKFTHCAKKQIEQLVALNEGHEIVCVAGPRHE